MKSTCGRLIAGALSLGIVAATACVHDDGSIFVRGVIAPPIALAGTACLYTPDPAGATLFYGTLDVGLASLTGQGYTPVLLIGNQLVARGNSDQLRVESNRVALQGATVRLTDANGGDITSFTVYGAGFVDPASGTTPGYGSFAATLVDANTIVALNAGGIPKRLIAYVTVFGQTTGGVHVETGEFQFPINTCIGCLVNFPPDSVDVVKQAATGKTNCDAVSGGTTSISPPCTTGQDQTIDCRLCKASLHAAICNP